MVNLWYRYTLKHVQSLFGTHFQQEKNQGTVTVFQTQSDIKTICFEFLHSSVREVIIAPNRARLPKNQENEEKHST
jgi:hypothetical protein